MKNIAIVGGGPGGLFTAHILEKTCAGLCKATIFEALDRTGGKLVTRSFHTAPVLYEAGVAEFYDYSRFGSDPIRDLLERLGLKTVPMLGPAVIINDKILNTDGDITRKMGKATLNAINAFHETCEALLSADDYYENYWRADNLHPWSHKTFAEVLDAIPDEAARRYIATAVHTDVAAPPHLTTALNGAKNVLMGNDKYLHLYGIEGGNERLVECLGKTLTSESCSIRQLSRSARQRRTGTASPSAKKASFDTGISTSSC